MAGRTTITINGNTFTMDGNEAQRLVSIPVGRDEKYATVNVLAKYTEDPPESRGFSGYMGSEKALQLIAESVRSSPDPQAAAGRWITKITNTIIEAAKQKEEES